MIVKCKGNSKDKKEIWLGESYILQLVYITVSRIFTTQISLLILEAKTYTQYDSAIKQTVVFS